MQKFFLLFFLYLVVARCLLERPTLICYTESDEDDHEMSRQPIEGEERNEFDNDHECDNQIGKTQLLHPFEQENAFLDTTFPTLPLNHQPHAFIEQRHCDGKQMHWYKLKDYAVNKAKQCCNRQNAIDA